MGFSLVAASGGHSSLRCAGLSPRWPLSLQSTGSSHAGFSSCGSRALLLRGMWDPPRPGLEPMYPALAGRLSTTAAPGKPHLDYFYLFAITKCLLMSIPFYNHVSFLTRPRTCQKKAQLFLENFCCLFDE